MTHRAQYLFLKKKNIFLKKHMRIRNEPKFLIKTPAGNEKKTCVERSFSQNISAEKPACIGMNMASL